VAGGNSKEKLDKYTGNLEHSACSCKLKAVHIHTHARAPVSHAIHIRGLGFGRWHGKKMNKKGNGKAK